MKDIIPRRRKYFGTVRLSFLAVMSLTIVALAQPPGPAGLEKISAKGMLSLAGKDSGKVVMINIWATWCGECRAEMPGVLKLRKAFTPDQFKLYLFSADDADDSTKATAFLDSLHVDFRTYIKSELTDQDFIDAIDSTWSGALPTTLIFNSRGNRVAEIVGAKTYEYYVNEIKKGRY